MFDLPWSFYAKIYKQTSFEALIVKDQHSAQITFPTKSFNQSNEELVKN